MGQMVFSVLPAQTSLIAAQLPPRFSRSPFKNSCDVFGCFWLFTPNTVMETPFHAAGFNCLVGIKKCLHS